MAASDARYGRPGDHSWQRKSKESGCCGANWHASPPAHPHSASAEGVYGCSTGAPAQVSIDSPIPLTCNKLTFRDSTPTIACLTIAHGLGKWFSPHRLPLIMSKLFSLSTSVTRNSSIACIITHNTTLATLHSATLRSFARPPR